MAESYTHTHTHTHLTSAEPKRPRAYALDVLKTLAMAGVVVNHSLWHLRSSAFFHYLVYMAVPVFMIVSGFVFSRSFEKKGSTLLSYFYPPVFLSRLGSYFFPFLIVVIIEGALKRTLDFSWILSALPVGGIGPGSYYVPVFFQFLLLFPFLYKLADLPRAGTWIIFVFAACFEVGAVWAGMSAPVYRLMFFRYIVFVWLGILLFRYGFSVCFVIGGAFLSAGYITLVFLSLFNTPLFYGWKATSFLTAPYALLFVWLFLRAENKSFFSWIRYFNTGRIVYFVFLIQLLYFTFFKGFPERAWYKLPSELFICFTGGFIFYFGYDLCVNGVLFLKKQIFESIKKDKMSRIVRIKNPPRS